MMHYWAAWGMVSALLLGVGTVVGFICFLVDYAMIHHDVKENRQNYWDLRTRVRQLEEKLVEEKLEEKRKR